MKAVSEDLESKAFVRWVRYDMQGVLEIAHIPNETPTTPEYANILKAMGVSRGFPDYIVVHVRTRRICFVEMKKRRGGKRPEEQKRWIRLLGKRAKFCNGHHEAIRFVTRRLL